MSKSRMVLIVLVLFASCILLQGAVTANVFAQGKEEAGQPAKESPKKAAVSAAQKSVDPYAKEVTKKGKSVVVTKDFADLVRKNNAVVLSKVAVKQKVDESGKVTAYQLVQIDRGSSVDRMGFKAGDLVTAVNGVPARDLVGNQKTLEQEKRFDVELIRKGKPMKITVEIE
jgi:type II secretory pathway component PulC